MGTVLAFQKFKKKTRGRFSRSKNSKRKHGDGSRVPKIQKDTSRILESAPFLVFLAMKYFPPTIHVANVLTICH
jgi:hypothetical protein